MNKTRYFFIVAISALFLAGCKGSTPAPSTEELMKKSWTVQSVTENGVSVYANGSGTKPGYSQFQLNLSNPPAVTLRTVDNQTFTGTYTISGSTLTLTGLTQLTGGPTITYTIGSLTESNVTLTRTTGDPKTGNSTNVYTLKTP